MIKKEDIIQILEKCYDPEIPIDVWNLGLIYNIESTDTLPSYYKYNLGGQATMRGWANETPNSEAKLIYDLINTEYRFPIYKKIGAE